MGILQAGEVSSGQSVTNRANSIKLGREKGFVVYLADSETEMVEWMSALEGTVSRLMRIIAGVDEEAGAAPDNSSRRQFASSQSAFLAQSENAYKSSHSVHRDSEPSRRSGLAVQGVSEKIDLLLVPLVHPYRPAGPQCLWRMSVKIVRLVLFMLRKWTPESAAFLFAGGLEFLDPIVDCTR